MVTPLDCQQLERRLTAGDDPSGPDVVAHLATCAVCREQVDDQGEVTRQLQVAREDLSFTNPRDVEAMAAMVRGEIALEGGPRPWLRSLPTWLRRALAIAALFAIVGATLTAVGPFGPRPDLALYPRVRMVCELGLLAVLALITLWTALRPLHQPDANRGASTLLVALGLLGPALVLTVLPPAETGHPMAYASYGSFWRHTLGCAQVGFANAAPLAVLLWLVARSGDRRRAVLAAIGAGLAGVLASQLHCPIVHRAHVMLGHATCAASLVLALLCLRVVRPGK